MTKRQTITLLKRATEGLLASLTDLVLFSTFLPTALIGKRSPADTARGFKEAQEMLSEVNYRSIKQALYRLTKRGLITRSPKRSQLEFAITEAGKKRIDAILPIYQTKRPWDGNLYLISYDIPIKANQTRNLLREYIRRIGAGLLQESLWMTPYNPRSILESFMHDHHVTGTILISKLGKDGSIGNETLNQLVSRVYRLKKLATRYEEFITTYKNISSPNRMRLTFDYYGILQDDPQLPFKLLPRDFPGHRAYVLYRTLLSSR